jgi:small subunit ribosomal protein S17
MTTEQTPPVVERNLRKERIGVVTSTAMNKSIVVAVERKEKHPKYGKFVNKTSKFMAHDEQETCKVGDTVRIMETRPLSKRKCWRLVEVIERAK